MAVLTVPLDVDQIYLDAKHSTTHSLLTVRRWSASTNKATSLSVPASPTWTPR